MKQATAQECFFGGLGDITSEWGTTFIYHFWTDGNNHSPHHCQEPTSQWDGWWRQLLCHAALCLTGNLLGMWFSPKEGLLVPSPNVFWGGTLRPWRVFPPLFTTLLTTTISPDLDTPSANTALAPQTFTNSQKRHLSKSVHSCRYVFIRNDAHRTPLMGPLCCPQAQH